MLRYKNVHRNQLKVLLIVPGIFQANNEGQGEGEDTVIVIPMRMGLAKNK